MGDGGYAPIGEALVQRCDVDAYLLEYDSRRAGDFAPLRHLPAGKRAYLGIISTKNPALESPDDLCTASRKRPATRPMDRLGICPQCGFRQRGDVEICGDAEQGYDRHSDAQDRASGRRRPPCLGPCVMRALTELDSYGLFTAEAVQDPYPYYKALRERERVHWSETGTGLVLHALSRRLRIAGSARPERRSDRDALLLSAAHQSRAFQRHRRPLSSLAALPRRRLSRPPEGAVPQSDDAARGRAPAADAAAPGRCDARRAGRRATRSTPISISPPAFRPR